jgi:hypothetical protein
MSEAIGPGDRVRVLGRHGETVGVGVVVALTAKDRTHVSRRVAGRPLARVRIDGSGLAWAWPVKALRRVER